MEQAACQALCQADEGFSDNGYPPGTVSRRRGTPAFLTAA
jgi:hypothetical protein